LRPRYRTTQQRGQAAQRRGRHLPQYCRGDAPGGLRARRAA
jgi:hypothetical protein